MILIRLLGLGVNISVEEAWERCLVLYISGNGYSKFRIFLTHICFFFFEDSAKLRYLSKKTLLMLRTRLLKS